MFIFCIFLLLSLQGIDSRLELPKNQRVMRGPAVYATPANADAPAGVGLDVVHLD